MNVWMLSFPQERNKASHLHSPCDERNNVWSSSYKKAFKRSAYRGMVAVFTFEIYFNKNNLFAPKKLKITFNENNASVPIEIYQNLEVRPYE